MASFELKKLLINYCAGSCSDKEKKAIDHWLDSPPENNSNVWEGLNQAEKQKFLEGLLVKIRSTMQGN